MRNYWESKDRYDRRIFVTSGGYLHAIDARTGKIVDSFADHGKLDLKIGIDRAPDSAGVANRRAHLRQPDHSRQRPRRRVPCAAGRYPRFRCRTGQARVGLPHHSPPEGELGYDTWPRRTPTNIWAAWMSGAKLPSTTKRGIVYFPMSSAKYELYGGDRPGNNLFADCLLALDARTGKYLWHFQTVHHDLWDYDPTAAPQLATVKHDGKTVDIVALASKNGFLYVFDRVTGKPLWPIEERPVPKSDVPGEWTSPTQPFPTHAAAVCPPEHDRDGPLLRLHDSRGADALEGAFRQDPEQRHFHARRPDRYNVDPGRERRSVLLGQRARMPLRASCFVESKDHPSILKMVKAGESTAENSGGTIPSRIRGGRSGTRRTRRGRWSADGAALWPHNL